MNDVYQGVGLSRSYAFRGNLGKPVKFPCLVFMQRVNGKPPVRPWRPRGAILIYVNVIGRRKFWRMGGTTGTAIAAVAGTVPAAG